MQDWKNERESPIGVFDSGMGGLTVLRELEKRLPKESFVYYGDTARAPYGNRKPEEVCAFALEIGDWLMQRGCKMLVFACHTASVLGMSALSSVTKEPVLGMVEAAVAEALDPDTPEIWPVGMIATRGTAESGDYQKAFARACPGKPFFITSCPGFVPLVEKGILAGPEVEQAVQTYLAPLREAGVRTLVYGCTHYPFLAGPISKYMGESVRLADPARKLAQIVEQALSAGGMENHGAGRARGAREFWCSGPTEDFAAFGSFLLGHPLQNIRRHLF